MPNVGKIFPDVWMIFEAFRVHFGYFGLTWLGIILSLFWSFWWGFGSLWGPLCGFNENRQRFHGSKGGRRPTCSRKVGARRVQRGCMEGAGALESSAEK